jgi:hypothetical protein
LSSDPGSFEDMDRETFTLRLSNPGDPFVHETEITAEQALDLGAGKDVPYHPRNKQIVAGENGELIERDSAVPVERDDEPPQAA